jgi:hypothetical protein
VNGVVKRAATQQPYQSRGETMMSLVSPLSAEGVIEELSVDPTANDLFAQALRDNSNLEMNWLWLITKVLTDGQRAYCL